MSKQMMNHRNNKQFGKVKQHTNHLFGKVVLLVGNDSNASRSLITKLAEKGAHIVLLCQKLSENSAQRIRRSVENLGSRFLLLENGDHKPLTMQTVVQTVKSHLGKLDIFIDISTNEKENEQLGELNDPSLLEQSYPDWMFLKAILGEFSQT